MMLYTTSRDYVYHWLAVCLWFSTTSPTFTTNVILYATPRDNVYHWIVVCLWLSLIIGPSLVFGQ